MDGATQATRRVLILTYYYPPCNLTAARRPASWVRYLPEFGYEVVVVTRCWDRPVARQPDMFHACGTAVEVLRSEGSEVHVLPYRPSVRDRVYTRHGEDRRVVLRKALSVFERLSEHVSERGITYHSIAHYADRLLQDHQAGSLPVVVTGGPFAMFRFGYELRRRNPGLHWIADYRDDWTTSPLWTPRSTMERLLWRLERRSERRWVGSADLVTSVTEDCLDRITALTGRPGALVQNGYEDEELLGPPAAHDPGVFLVTYAGTLYPTQPVEVFLDGAIRAIRRWRHRVRIKVNFTGIAYLPDQARRVEERIPPDLRDAFTLGARVSHTEAVQIEKKSNVLLLISHRGPRGIASSKLYEYVGLRKPVLLCPAEGGVMQSTLEATGLGIMASTAEQVEQVLGRMMEDVLERGAVAVSPNEGAIRALSRRGQAAVLARALDALQDTRGTRRPRSSRP